MRDPCGEHGRIMFKLIRVPFFFIIKIYPDDTEPEQDVNNIADFRRLDSCVLHTLRNVGLGKDNARTDE